MSLSDKIAKLGQLRNDARILQAMTAQLEEEAAALETVVLAEVAGLGRQDDMPPSAELVSRMKAQQAISLPVEQPPSCGATPPRFENAVEDLRRTFPMGSALVYATLFVAAREMTTRELSAGLRVRMDEVSKALSALNKARRVMRRRLPNRGPVTYAWEACTAALPGYHTAQKASTLLETLRREVSATNA